MISGVRASSTRIEFDLVDDGEDVPALDHVLQAILHVVAQIVEAELVVGAVGDVAVVGLLALLVVKTVDDDADRETEEIVDLAHPFGVAPGEVVVDGHHMHAPPGQRIEIDCKRGDQRLAFAGLHLGNATLVQDHAADRAGRRNAADPMFAWRLRGRLRMPAPEYRPARHPRRPAA